MRWAGIDEAGYGPNLGPLVMTAVVAEGADDRPPDLWADLPATISRAGGLADRLWVDDSKKVYKARKGRERLDSATLAVLEAAGLGTPETLGGLLSALGAGTLADAELTPWIEGVDPDFPATAPPGRPLGGAPWSIVAVRSELVGPARFNAALAASGSKASVHFGAFARLLADLWASTPEGGSTAIRGDKHGGRHFYGDLLAETFPEARVKRGAEGPELSRYEVVGSDRRLAIELVPRADSGDGLVALASLVSKAVRERWMDAFNAFWQARVSGLRATAGYPVDALRFRRAIEARAEGLGLDSSGWWRAK